MFEKLKEKEMDEDNVRFDSYNGSQDSMDEYSAWWREIGEREGYFFDAMVQECEDIDGSVSDSELTFDTLMKQACS